MRKESGIPRPSQPNDQAQELRDLKRKVAQLEARRNFVSVERIVEGGTLNPAVGTQITETVQRDIVIEGSNLAEGALSVVGETVEAEPKRLTAQLRTVERDNPDGVAETYAAAPSLVFSLDGEGPTAVDPGIYSFDGYSLRLTAPGAGDDPMTYVNVSPGKFQAQAVTSEIGAEFWSRNVTIGNTGLGLPGSPMADVNILGNVKVNGSPLTDSAWKTATYLNSWMDYGNGFGGLQYRLLNGVLYLRGTIKGGAVNSIVTNLPTGYRPTLPTGASATEFPITARQGTTWYSGTMYAYANGDLRYDAPPGVWSGADRVIINAAFPL